MEVREERDYNYTSSYTVTTRMTPGLRRAAMRDIFNASFIVRDKVARQCPAQTTAFEENEEPKRIRAEVPLLTGLTPYRLAKPAQKYVNI